MTRNFLVIDNEEIICNGMKQALDSLGLYNVYTAENGVEALECVEKKVIDAIFLDVEMPEMNGIEFMRKLKEKDLYPVVVVISGYDEFEYAREALRYGALDYILKPVDSDDVKALGKRMYKLIESNSLSIADSQEEEDILQVTEIGKGIGKITPELIAEYIEKNYSNQDLSVTEISKQMGYSPNYIGSTFKKEFGTSINDYINKYRVIMAKELMKDSDMKMYEISYAVGYADQHYFSKVFKKYEGVSPSDYH